MSRSLILNVDDHSPTRYARTRLLTAAGFTVIDAQTGEEAAALVEKHRPDLVLLDINLPDANGIEVSRRLKNRGSDYSVIVIQITASAVSAASATAALDAGADAFLPEPVEPDVLIATVRAMLRLHHSERSLAHAKRQLEIANRELRRSNEDLQQFAFAASHDLQEPLRTITTFTEIIQADLGDTLTEKQKECFAHVIRGAGRMRVLIRDLLTYSQVGREDRLPEFVDLGKVVAWALANLEQQIQATEGEIEVPAELPQVWGDFAHLGLVFQNLLSNSLKYRKPDVPPRIRISVERSTPAEWIVSVSDNGVGIPAAYREDVFAPFKRLHGANVPGSGIGLALCRRIIQAHGGKIWLEPGDDGGVVFRMTLRAE